MENSESSNNVASSTSEVRSEVETPSVPSINAESIHRTPPRIRVRRFESLSSGPPNSLSPCTNEQVDTEEPPRVRVRIHGEEYSLSSLQFGNLASYPSALPARSMNVPAATPFATPIVPFLFQGSSERSTFNPYETTARYHYPVLRVASMESTRTPMVPPPRPLRATGTRSANLNVAPTSTEPPVVVIDADDDASNDEPVEEMETDGEPENEPEVQQPVPVNDPKPSTSCPSALSSVDDGDSGTVCTICYSPYTNSGDHRISCLKCGHIFGQSCIKRWFKNGCQNSNKRCPSCNAKATVRDLRTIFASNLVALDTTEKDELIEKLHKLQNEKNLTESVLNSERLKNEQLTEQIRKYEAKIKELTTNGNLREQNEVVQKVSIFNSKMLSSFSLCSEGACRVLAYTSQLSLLLASQAAASVIPSYGIRKINMHDMKPTSYHHIHQKTIRDMSFSPFERGHLLSVSLDRTAKLYDTQSNIVVQTFTTPVALWSCTWSSVDSNKFYCGGQNGTWFAFDKRQPRLEPQEIVETSDDKDKSGILSMSHIPPRPGRFMPNGGVIACRLNQIVAHYTSGDEIVKKVLPIEGPFMSMQYNRRNDHLLISAKASKNKWNTSRHMVCQLSELTGVEGEYDGIDVLQTFNGSPMCEVLSRSTFVPFPNGDLTVCAHNQRNASMDLWSVVSGSKLPLNDVHLNEPIYDIASFSVDDKDLIIPCLSAKKLSVIKLSF